MIASNYVQVKNFSYGEDVCQLVVFPGNMLDIETEPFQLHDTPAELISLVLGPIEPSEGDVVRG
jgi:hypothetical protein